MSDFVSDNALKFASETRNVEVVHVPKDVAEFPQEPNDKDLKDFYFENSYQFQIPEMRDISYIILPRTKENESAVYEQTVKIEDELAAGSSLKEIADKFKLKLEVENGLTHDSKDFPEQFVQTAFGKDSGKTSDLVYDDKAKEYYVIEVNKIAEARIPDLQEVRADAVAMWKEKKANDLNWKRVGEMNDELAKSGEDLRRFAASHGYRYELVSGVKRDDNEKFGARFVTDVFGSKEGEMVGAYQDSDGNFRLAKLKAIEHTPLSDEAADKFDEAFADTVKVEIMDQYMDYLRHKFPIKQNVKYADEQGNQLKVQKTSQPQPKLKVK